MSLHTQRLALAASFALAFAPLASAQTAAPATAAPETASSEVGADTLPKDAASKVDQHIKRLHDQLAITPAEQPQWDQFAQVMRSNAAQMHQVSTERGAKAVGMTAADSMKSYADLAQVHAANMQKLASSFQALYDAFPDAQKKVADKVFLTSAGPGGRKR